MRSARTSSTTRTTGRIQPRAYANDYTLPEKVYEYTPSMQQELGRQHGGDRSPTSAARAGTCSCAASRTARSACRATARRRGTQVREFDIVTCANGTVGTGSDVPGLDDREHPAAVRRDRLQDQRRPRQLQRDAAVADPPVAHSGVALNGAVHAGLQQGQHGRIERGGHRGQQRPARSPTSTTTTATTTSTCATRST